MHRSPVSVILCLTSICISYLLLPYLTYFAWHGLFSPFHRYRPTDRPMDRLTPFFQYPLPAFLYSNHIAYCVPFCSPCIVSYRFVYGIRLYITITIIIIININHIIQLQNKKTRNEREVHRTTVQTHPFRFAHRLVSFVSVSVLMPNPQSSFIHLCINVIFV